MSDEQGRSLPDTSGIRTGGAADGEPDQSATAPAGGTEAEEQAKAIYAEILSRAPEHKISPTIDRVAALVDLLGNPQHSYRAIHLTGTNGKTSTARMVERLLREMGLRTGRFTSPHLHNVRERIAIDGEPISATAFVEVWHDIEPYVQIVDAQLEEKGHPRLNFFEVLAAFAFAAFADAPVDVAVVEVGLGGEWDSTNVIDGDVAVLTPIARDHEKWLGHSLEEIATVKSGIIKQLDPPAVVVTAEQDDEVAAVIARRAVERGARLVAQGYDIEVAERTMAVGGQLVNLRGTGGLYTDIFLPLHGPHQAQNALIALTAVEQFLGGGALGAEVVEAAFGDATSPGRMELVRSSPAVLVDAAHNPAGAGVLVQALDEAFAFTRLVGVVGVMEEKDAEGILSVLEPVLDEVVITQSTSMRSMDADDLAEIARDVFDPDQVHVQASLPNAISVAADLAEQGERDQIASGTGVLVTGSVILAAEARAVFGKDKPPRRPGRSSTS
ncbi:bifunctional folylpolyglutamate synthase/dihydrofolate synthase [Ruania alba]|uniref:tetrahydrofolate synthase n=1 Tax=Ruania alba TaxID=648782 RepID=A0A1H5DVG0_9MICO|nr:folylpolyglutamate synthase/dihydrofolate synthase family protein [Ruania alba]SED82690.1 dihydrofolate synthase / folylpolyglutamate synthase [Ruania alba]